MISFLTFYNTLEIFLIDVLIKSNGCDPPKTETEFIKSYRPNIPHDQYLPSLDSEFIYIYKCIDSFKAMFNIADEAPTRTSK